MIDVKELVEKRGKEEAIRILADFYCNMEAIPYATAAWRAEREVNEVELNNATKMFQ